jgi:endogenous inhibitor of DNA gyrase (YacG/DUF329 family)
MCGSNALFAPENAFRPFCSERCRLIDLGTWATSGYSIAGTQIAVDAEGNIGQGPPREEQGH